MAKILITGARAPIAWEWANIMKKSPHEVILGDSFTFPVGRFVSKTRYLHLPAAIDYENYVDAILAEKFDLIIPTCEEAVHLSRAGNRFGDNVLFSHNFEFMKTAHDKLNVFSLFESDDIQKPITSLIRSSEELPNDPILLKRSILKPRFSRFGNRTILNITPNTLKTMLSREYVLQEKIVGDELCSYSICSCGNVMQTMIYRPVYRLGTGASIYFRPVYENRIENFVREFVRNNRCHGQLAFDFMQTKSGEIYLLECNPRGTSGIHLLRNSLDTSFLFGEENRPMKNVAITPMCLKTMMILLAPRLILQKGVKTCAADFMAARDVFPLRFLPYGLASLTELIVRSIISGRSLEETSTDDICWNGEE